MSNNEEEELHIDVDELIAAEKEKHRIKLANRKWREEIKLREQVSNQLKREKKLKREAAAKKKKEKEQKEFELRLAKARGENVSVCDSPVKKKAATTKKKPSSKKKKLVPPPGNAKMDRYLSQALTSPDAKSPEATFTTPPTVPKTVETTSVMTKYSVISCSAASMKSTDCSSVSTSTVSGVNLSMTCKGCNNPMRRYMEYRWRKLCLHSVLDYFERVGADSICEAGVRETYYDTFAVKIKGKIMEQSGGFYEIEENLVIPECMVKGSLQDAIEW